MYTVTEDKQVVLGKGGLVCGQRKHQYISTDLRPVPSHAFHLHRQDHRVFLERYTIKEREEERRST